MRSCTAAGAHALRILVAEDDLDLLEMACRLFQALGQEAHGAGTAGFGFEVVAKPYRLHDLRAMLRRLTINEPSQAR